ncbi:L,D-transpeptidase [Bacteroides sp.]|uniref:L,D-transpeptidase n=1 Tax=Bacteroides sp. TaxID=29523 RepID=UPI001B57178D|nr:L,D-transpeptidase [Bacteroides sp.]MBP6064447.1 L,D-transpeptidase [Bacteroides sp.]MBP6067216.1 L,D-transpeptidase [Bacteroides sp.]MBP6936247.1 L,D-transpeptidase [Bacteroides sp.]MBP8621166.1 L,D-transpeptidase [Bacteroides sp.]MBP9506842.1 L,D-transpeptidase [Bacteroides sp.]
MNRLNINISLLTLGILCSCAANVESKQTADQQKQTDSLAMLDTLSSSAVIEIKPIDVQISKELLYDKYTLEDTYPYKDTTRSYQWEKMKERLALLENIQAEPKRWGILQNYKNRNGEAPLVRNYKRNTYRRIADTLGVERYQSVPLYLLTDTLIPERYGQDGDLVSLLREEGSFTEVEPIFIGSTWMVPQKYIKPLQDTVIFKKAVFIDRTNQNIITLEQKGRAEWMVRSMNPATTGLHRPPYQQETPLGMFVLQEKKVKMVFLKDGSIETGGYAPYASRFTDGAYIHGVPVNAPRTALIEYSPSLGTTPRSHMCVRNATSHAKFLFDWAPVNQTIVFILE